MGGYLCRVLSCPPHGETKDWTIWPKDLTVASVSAESEQDGFAQMKVLCAAVIDKAMGSDPQENIPWTDISCVLTPGAKTKWILVPATAPKRIIQPGKA